MSDVIRNFRIANPVYQRGEKTMDGRHSPFRLPSLTVEKEPLPDVVIEGVPPVGGRSQQASKRRTTDT